MLEIGVLLAFLTFSCKPKAIPLYNGLVVFWAVNFLKDHVAIICAPHSPLCISFMSICVTPQPLGLGAATPPTLWLGVLAFFFKNGQSFS